MFSVKWCKLTSSHAGFSCFCGHSSWKIVALDKFERRCRTLVYTSPLVVVSVVTSSCRDVTCAVSIQRSGYLYCFTFAVYTGENKNITSSAFLFLTSCGANFNICQKVCVSKCWYSLYVFIKYSKRLYHWLYYDTDSFHSISTYLYCVDYIGLIPIEPLFHFSRKTIWGAFGEISKY